MNQSWPILILFHHLPERSNGIYVKPVRLARLEQKSNVGPPECRVGMLTTYFGSFKFKPKMWREKLKAENIVRWTKRG